MIICVFVWSSLV